MKIIVWGINYAPEQTGIAPYNQGLCEHLAAAGHDVRMLTGFPYYPEWRKPPGDSGRLWRTDTIGAIRVHRCFQYVPRRPNAIRRMVHEATFLATSWLRFLTLPAPDVVVAVSPPLLLGVAAWLGCLLKRRPFIFHVQDMQPDAAVLLGLLKPGLFTRTLYAIERFAYRRAALVSGITPGMITLFRAKGIAADRCLLFPNWTHGAAPEPASPGAFRPRVGLPGDAFLAVYSGNLGKKQGLDILLDAARLLAADSDPDAARVRLVIAGDGVEKPALEARVAAERLTNVALLPLQPTAAYGEMLADADVCLVTQQPGSGALFFPSKLLTILAHARPVVTVADAGGELEQAVSSGGFGWSSPPEQPAALAALLKRVASDPAGRAQAGRAGRSWVAQFGRAHVLERFEALLRERFNRPSA